MPSDDESGPLAAQGETSFPGRLSALLQELARAPGGAPPERAGAGLQPGAVVGRFEVVREVGRGGFGVVYQARDAELHRDVALKLIRAERRADAGGDRLQREAEAAARLSHPNIVTLFDAGVCDHGPYLVMEFLRGETLEARLRRGPVPLAEALDLAVGIAEGLAHAHGEGIIHRDLKPANVFVTDRGHAKILDLGLAHAFGRRRLEGGTPGFMAPEQERGAPEDERTDVYALGLILHWLLSGAPHWAGGRRPAGPPPRLDLPALPGMPDLVASMLATDPTGRPRDAAAVLPALVALRTAASRSGDEAPPARRSRLGPPLRLAAGAVAALALALTLVGAGAWWRTRAPPIPAAPPSIAVLPFADLSPQGDQGYFSEGLADEILSALARIEGLRVPGRTSSFAFKDKAAGLAEIGRALNVASVLEGSVRMAGRRVRVTASVVDVADGYRRWTETYDRELTDIFSVQDEIAASVVRALGGALLPGKEAAVTARSTTSPEAYQLYLLGRQGYHRLSREGYQEAVQAFEKAVAIDPGYAPAWAGLAIPLNYLAGYQETREETQAFQRRALAAAERAVSLDPDLPEARSARGALRGTVLGDMDGALGDFEHALRIKPNDTEAHRRKAILLMELGRLPEAVAAARRAVELDPLGLAWTTLGTMLQYSGDLASAEVAFLKHRELAPGAMAVLVGLGRNLLLQGRHAEALAAFEATGDRDFVLWGRAAAEHALGRPQASEEAYQALLASRGTSRAFYLAELQAWRGRPEAALDLLERGWYQQEGRVSLEIAVDPFLSSVRSDPRFQALLQRMRQPRPAPAGHP